MGRRVDGWVVLGVAAEGNPREEGSGSGHPGDEDGMEGADRRRRGGSSLVGWADVGLGGANFFWLGCSRSRGSACWVSLHRP